MKYFKPSEFQCPCCGTSEMDSEVEKKIDLIRDRLGVPLHINSGYRCSAHNREVGGKPTSQHLVGKAIDVSIANLTAEKKRQFLELAIGQFFGVGIGSTFFHLDLGTPRLWVYGSGTTAS